MLEKAFEKMGARLKRRVHKPVNRYTVIALGRQRRIRKVPARGNVVPDMVRVDVGRDKKGEYFDILTAEGVEPEIVDVRKDLRHLVMMVRRENGRKDKFLCGHDERHWFVAALPNEGVKSVVDAMRILRPTDVKEGVKRQGEWFFIPCPDLDIPDDFAHKIHSNEPIQRGRSKPHICEEIYREGGELTYIKGNSFFTPEEFKKATEKDVRQRGGWRSMIRDAQVYARGAIRHPDHYTLYLDGWHIVRMNREDKAPHSEAVVFLD